MTNDPIIETTALGKTYRSLDAVRDLDLKVPRGTICGFLGRNGAGKTTTIKMLTGLISPSRGIATVLGRDMSVESEAVEAHRRMGFVSDEKVILPYMTVAQILDFSRPFFPDWRKDLEARFLRAFELSLEKRISTFSKGMHTKLAVLLAAARGPELIILDEPTEGLDPAMIEEVLHVLVTLAAEEGVTVFFSTHQITEVEQICDRIAIIDKGRLILNDSIDALKENYRRVHLVFEEEAQAQPLLAMAGVEQARSSGRSVSLLVSGNLDAVLGQARSLNGRTLDVCPVSLKEIFLDAVKPEVE
jgi:ABC-2 type transport system ATP-binding protein